MIPEWLSGLLENRRGQYRVGGQRERRIQHSSDQSIADSIAASS